MEQDAAEKPMELKDKRVLVVGLGRSGVSSAIFLQEHGAKVIVSDSKAEAQLQSEVPALLDRGIFLAMVLTTAIRRCSRFRGPRWSSVA